MHSTASVTVLAPIGRVFVWLDEADKLKQWLAGLEEVTYLKPGVPRGAGSRFLYRLREGGHVTEYQGEVTAYRPPEELAVRLSSPHLEMDIRYRLASRQGSTSVEQTVVLASLSRLARLTLPLAGRLLLRRQARQLARLKVIVERAASPP
jgi:uncharacterized protein YndB with AHSA1/START domain